MADSTDPEESRDRLLPRHLPRLPGGREPGSRRRRASVQHRINRSRPGAPARGPPLAGADRLLHGGAPALPRRRAQRRPRAPTTPPSSTSSASPAPATSPREEARAEPRDRPPPRAREPTRRAQPRRSAQHADRRARGRANPGSARCSPTTPSSSRSRWPSATAPGGARVAAGWRRRPAPPVAPTQLARSRDPRRRTPGARRGASYASPTTPPRSTASPPASPACRARPKATATASVLSAPEAREEVAARRSRLLREAGPRGGRRSLHAPRPDPRFAALAMRAWRCEEALGATDDFAQADGGRRPVRCRGCSLPGNNARPPPRTSPTRFRSRRSRSHRLPATLTPRRRVVISATAACFNPPASLARLSPAPTRASATRGAREPRGRRGAHPPRRDRSAPRFAGARARPDAPGAPLATPPRRPTGWSPGRHRPPRRPERDPAKPARRAGVARLR